MLLLNHIPEHKVYCEPFLFTFQYASIKPLWPYNANAPVWKFTFQYASIKPVPVGIPMTIKNNLHFNMLLLNPVSELATALKAVGFTFQYASIKPKKSTKAAFRIKNLHFNMLLLNR